MPADPQGLPESVFTFGDTMLVFDHLRHDIKVVSHAHLNGDIEAAYQAATAKIDEMVDRLSKPLELPAELQSFNARESKDSGEVVSNFNREGYEDAIDKCIEYIYSGDVIQVVNSQRFSRRTDAHPFQVYRSLRSINPSPYMYYLQLGDFQIIGAAIETVVMVEDGIAATHPIAGTRPRGQTPEEDAALGGGTQNQREAARGAHNAGGPGTQRHWPGKHPRDGVGHPVDGRRALLPRHAPGLPRGGAHAARPYPL